MLWLGEGMLGESGAIIHDRLPCQMEANPGKLQKVGFFLWAQGGSPPF
jgi:hypothetical protein